MSSYVGGGEAWSWSIPGSWGYRGNAAAFPAVRKRKRRKLDSHGGALAAGLEHVCALLHVITPVCPFKQNRRFFASETANVNKMSKNKKRRK